MVVFDGHQTKSLIHDGMVKGRFSGDDNDEDCDFCSQNFMGVKKKNVQNQLVGCLVTILTEIRWLRRSLQHTCSKDLFGYFGSGAWYIPHWLSGAIVP